MESLQSAILSKLVEFQQEGIFADLTIQLKDGDVPAISPLVAAMSPVFQTMLTTDMRERNMREVKLRDVSQETWNCLNKFYFSNQRLVTIDNVFDIISVCDMYEMEDLKSYCDNFLLSCCSTDNCLALQRIAVKFGLSAAASNAKQFIEQNFASICKSEDFLMLEKEELLELLKNPDLIVSEDDLCIRVLSWMETNKPDKEAVVEVFSQLRLPSISSFVLINQVIYHSFIRCNDVVTGLIQSELQQRYAVTLQPIQAVQLKRNADNMTDDIVILGHNGERMLFQTWLPATKEWLALPTPVIKVPERFAAAKVRESIVVTGGMGGSSHTLIFDLVKKAWSAGPDLIQGRYDHGMAVIAGSAYVVAGWNGMRFLSSIEEYNNISGQWTLIGNLQVATDDCGVVALGSKIVVVGGSLDISENIIQVFDVITLTASIIPTPLPLPMCHVRGVSFLDSACFVGSEGDMIRIQDDVGVIRLSELARLAGFGKRIWYGLYFNGQSVWVLGERSVDRFSMCGKKEEGNGIKAPLKDMLVHAVFRARIFPS